MNIGQLDVDDVLHVAAATGAKLCVKEAILSGALPKIHSIHKFSTHQFDGSKGSGTAVQKAILNRHFGIAKFLMANFFVHPSDHMGSFEILINTLEPSDRKRKCEEFFKQLTSWNKICSYPRMAKVSANAGCDNRKSKLEASGLSGEILDQLMFKQVKNFPVENWDSLPMNVCFY